MNSQNSTTQAESHSVRVIVSLGANLDSPAGSPRECLRLALQRLRAMSGRYFAASSLYRTTPVECLAGTPDFINAIAIMEVAADIEPHRLLEDLHAMETEFGRVRNTPDTARTLDLDIIAFGELSLSLPGLTLPHPRAQERRFVLEPLAELEPGLVLPGQSKSVQVLLENISADQHGTRLLTPDHPGH